MTTQADLLGAVGAEADARYKDITDRLTRIEEALATPPIPPEPIPDVPCLSGVYTGANNVSGQAEKDFGNWRGRTVEKVMTFTPDDSWSPTWWCSVFGGSFPFKDRLIITRGLCLKNENVDSPFPTGKFADWARAVKNAGITNPIWRLGHEANGNWYPWKITGHEQTWATRFEKCAAEIRSVDPQALIQMCLAAGQRTDGFKYPAEAYVDHYGVDLYDNGNQINDWDKHKAIADNYGVPFSVPEWGLWAADGSGGHGDNPTYIQKMHDLTVRDCTDGGFECYFNKDSSSQHKLDHYPLGQEEYLEDFGGFTSARGRWLREPAWRRAADPAD